MKAATAAALAVLLTARSAWPCASAPPRGHWVGILDEQALIVWDTAARQQHFIRRARFDADVPSFGFLVPTPTRPMLAEAPDAIFDALDRAVQPEIVTHTKWDIAPTLLCFPFVYMTRPVTTGAPPVRVLEWTRVAGYDAAVLQADDARALAGWLNENGYESRPELAQWLQPYVEKRWTITAFKVSGEPKRSPASTAAVRMSFAADRPFFPYREPADQRQGASVPRELRVYVVAGSRMEGTIGTGQPWTREVLYAAPKDGLRELLKDALPAELPAGLWLNAFHDTSSPRPGVDDLFFGAAATNEAYRPPAEVVEIRRWAPIPLDVFALLFVAWTVRRWRRRRAGASISS